MQYCPKCRCEYVDGTDICSDCDVDLVTEIPPEIPDDYKDMEWVELYKFPGALYLQMAVEMLNREDIPAYSQSTFGGGAGFGPTGGANYVGAGGSVYVLEADLDQAFAIIETMIDEIPTGLGDNDDDYGDE